MELIGVQHFQVESNLQKVLISFIREPNIFKKCQQQMLIKLKYLNLQLQELFVLCQKLFNFGKILGIMTEDSPKWGI